MIFFGKFPGDFYKDYVFLQELLERQTVTNRKTSLGEDVAPIVEEALKYLDTRADFWQKQEPLYRRDQPGAYKTAAGKQVKRGGALEESPEMKKIRVGLKKIQEMFDQGDYEGLLEASKDLVKKIER